MIRSPVRTMSQPSFPSQRQIQAPTAGDAAPTLAAEAPRTAGTRGQELLPTATAPLAFSALGVTAARAADTAPEGEPRAPTDLQLFLLLGLPNLPARGKVEEIDRELHERAVVMNKGFGWAREIYLDDWTEPELTHVELAAALARTVVEGRPAVSVGLIPAAFGGRSLADWMPGTPLYRGAVERGKIALKDGRLAGILWYQGPTGEDPAQAKEYAKRFAAMIAQLRTDLGVKFVPVIVGEVKPGAKGADLATPLAQVPQEVIPCFFVSSENLGAESRGRLDSTILWDYTERFAQAWMDLAQP